MGLDLLTGSVESRGKILRGVRRFDCQCAACKAGKVVDNSKSLHEGYAEAASDADLSKLRKFTVVDQDSKTRIGLANILAKRWNFDERYRQQFWLNALNKIGYVEKSAVRFKDMEVAKDMADHVKRSHSTWLESRKTMKKADIAISVAEDTIATYLEQYWTRMMASIGIEDCRPYGLEERMSRASEKALAKNAYYERCVDALEKLRSAAMAEASFVDVDGEIERRIEKKFPGMKDNWKLLAS